ncbi:Lcl C-terminal domain-containing protein [Nitrospina gracilis]|uniref:Lcl C-terminal domain-containing protein n=1 Tax=Nitrospina gracilis TaxID=35801 RepID=UPI001F1E0CDE|nr:DUF1566 domain-containing protein [Nitrospina gracilis]MCF8721286.1 hypothetical protein [Nitrospina gracilis Nb-211]
MRSGYSFSLLLMLWMGMMVSVATAADSNRFQKNGNGTVLDTQTGLMWQASDSYHELKKGMNWYDALEYVNQKNADKFAGYSDWRLPTMDELNALWDSSRPLASKDGEPIGLPEAFEGGGSYYLWSRDERNLDHAWYFGLGQSEDYFNLKDLGDLDQGVRMVREQKP